MGHLAQFCFGKKERGEYKNRLKLSKSFIMEEPFILMIGETKYGLLG